jgi:hypothetical protein
MFLEITWFLTHRIKGRIIPVLRLSAMTATVLKVVRRTLHPQAELLALEK